MEEKKEEKKKKVPGPVRFSAVIPLVVMLLLGTAYSMIFFDSNVKFAIEKVGMIVNGAEVNVADLVTDFKAGTLLIKDVQVTDKDKPEVNKVRIGELRFQFSWDALLRAKFVIEDATIRDIRISSPRERVGELSPPDTPSEEDQKFKQLNKVKKEGAKFVKEEFEGNVIGDAAALLEGKDDPLKSIKGDLKSLLEIESLEKELKEKEKAWSKRLAALPTPAEFKKLSNRIKRINFSKTKNPKKIKKMLKEVKSILGESERKIKLVNDSQKELSGDMKNFKASFKELDQLVKKDISDLEKRVKIPKLDTKNLSQQLFRKYILGKYASYEKYFHQVKEYLPKSKEKEVEKGPVRKRANGVNYHFGTPKSYPLFWLKTASISSKSDNSEFGGDIEGRINDLTTSPKMLGRPAVIAMKGEFPGMGIKGIDSRITIDQTGEKPVGKIAFTVGVFPVKSQKFVKTDKVSFGINRARGSTSINGTITEGKIDTTFDIDLKKVSYDISAESKMLKDILRGSLRPVTVVTIDGRMTGTPANPDLEISSNLAAALSAGFRGHLDKKVRDAKRKLSEYVNDRILNKKNALNGKFSGIQNRYMGQLDKIKGQSAGIKKLADNKKAQAKKQAKKKGLDALKKKFKRKKFKF